MLDIFFLFFYFFWDIASQNAKEDFVVFPCLFLITWPRGHVILPVFETIKNHTDASFIFFYISFSGGV